MRLKPFGKRNDIDRRIYTLSGNDIEDFSSWLNDVLTKAGVEHQNCLRIRLSMEEAVLRFRDRFGDSTVFEAIAAYQFGRPYIQLELTADAYNPLISSLSELEDWSGSLLTAVGLYPQYSYSGGKNVLKLVLPNRNYNPLIHAAAAVILGVLFGVIGSSIFKTFDLGFGLSEVYSLIFDIWTRMLNLLSGPVIFFMMITTVIGTGKISEIGGSGRTVLLRYFLLSILAADLAVLAVKLLVGFSIHYDAFEAQGLMLIREIIYGIMPAEIFSPFMESNTPQLLMMAFVIGTVLHVIGAQADSLIHLVKQMNMVGLVMTEWVGRLAPVFTCILIALELTTGRMVLLADMWKCVLIAFVMSMLLMLCVAWYVSRRMHISAKKLLRKIRKPFWVTLKSGTLNAAIGLTEKSCVNDLGIEKGFTEVSLAYGWILYLPASIIGTLVFTLYAAIKYNVVGGIMWVIAAIFMSVVLFVSTPPVPGANLLAFAVIFASLGIPKTALTDAMVFDIVFGLFAAAVNQAMLQMDMVLQAHKIRILDMKKLQK